MKKINLFISYSHKDDEFLSELKEYVNDRNCPKIQIWDDGKISPGSEWDSVIKKHMSEADIVLIMVSQLFLNSDYIRSQELSIILERHENRMCKVIPIFTRTCSLKGYPQITKLQGLPQGMKFLSEMEDERALHYTRIQEELNEIAEELQIVKSSQGPITDAKGAVAKEIDRLRNKLKIFLSVSSSEEGKRKRKEFLYQVEGKIKYEAWPYEIVPGIAEADSILDKDASTQKEFFETCLRDCIYSIHIVSSENELKEDLYKNQYSQAKANPLVFKSIVWLLTGDIKEKMNEDMSKTVCMNPVFTGNNYENLFQIINDLDREKEKKITELKTSISTSKKIFMFYDFLKDHKNPLRVELKKKIEQYQNLSVRLNVPNDPLEKVKESLEKCDGALIFYGETDPQWFLIRQALLFEASHVVSKAVCLDEPDIQSKIDSDVAAELLAIKGQQELETGVKFFVEKLQVAR